MKKSVAIIARIQTLVLTAGIAAPAQAAINIGAPLGNSGSVATLRVSQTNQVSGSTYTVIYPNGPIGSTTTGRSVTRVLAQPTGQAPTPQPSQGSIQPGSTSPTTGTSVISLNSYINRTTSTPSTGTSSVPIVVPVTRQTLPSGSSVPVSSPSTTPPTVPATPSSYPAIPPVASLTAEQQSIVDMVNQERANSRLSPLKVDFRLVSVAQAKAKDMETNNYFDHISPTYGTPWAMMAAVGLNVQWAGENIAYNKSVAAVMAAWMQSPGHRANILDPKFTHIGIGIVYGSAFGNLYVQEFAQE